MTKDFGYQRSKATSKKCNPIADGIFLICSRIVKEFHQIFLVRTLQVNFIKGAAPIVKGMCGGVGIRRYAGATCPWNIERFRKACSTLVPFSLLSCVSRNFKVWNSGKNYCSANCKYFFLLLFFLRFLICLPVSDLIKMQTKHNFKTRL